LTIISESSGSDVCRTPPVLARLLTSNVVATDPAESAIRNYLASLSTPDTFRQGFIEHAKAWAEAQDIPPEAFEQIGVPADVLREAGIVEGRPELTTPTPPDVTGQSQNGTSPSATLPPERTSGELSAAPPPARQRSAAWRVRRTFCRIVTGQAAVDGLRKCGLLR
jgi:hypothetical protein